MAGNGGKRPGAGRKKGSKNRKTIEVKQTLNDAIDRVAERRGGYDAVIEKLWELSEGVLVQKREKGGKHEEYVYAQPPDGFAAKTLLEFRFGKAAQTQTVQGDPNKPMRILVEYVTPGKNAD